MLEWYQASGTVSESVRYCLECGKVLTESNNPNEDNLCDTCERQQERDDPWL